MKGDCKLFQWIIKMLKLYVLCRSSSWLYGYSIAEMHSYLLAHAYYTYLRATFNCASKSLTIWLSLVEQFSAISLYGDCTSLCQVIRINGDYRKRNTSPRIHIYVIYIDSYSSRSRMNGTMFPHREENDLIHIKYIYLKDIMLIQNMQYL